MLRRLTLLAAALFVAVVPARAFDFENLPWLDLGDENHTLCRMFLNVDTTFLVSQSSDLLKEVWAKEEFRKEAIALVPLPVPDKFIKLMELARKAKLDEAKVFSYELTLNGWRSHSEECPNDEREPEKPKFDG